MSREVRRVPASWEHPKDGNGHYIAHYECFPYDQENIEEGLREGWLDNSLPNYGCNVMPQWPDAERTHYQMYESTTEGKPISPVMETPEALARWLADNNASAFGDMGATYEHWLSAIKCGWTVSLVNTSESRLVSGVEGLRLK